MVYTYKENHSYAMKIYERQKNSRILVRTERLEEAIIVRIVDSFYIGHSFGLQKISMSAITIKRR